MSGWERKKARHRTGMYLDEKLSHRIFLLTTAPRHTLQAPLPGPFETKPPLAILRHLPMTRAARARQGRRQLAGLGCRWVLQRCLRCDAGRDVRDLPHAVSCARCVTILDDDNRAARNFATISRRTNVYEVVVHKYT